MSIGHLITVTSLGPNPTLFLNKKTLFPCWQDISRHEGAGAEGNGAVGGGVQTLTRLVMLNWGLDGGDGGLDKDAKGVERGRCDHASYATLTSHPSSTASIHANAVIMQIERWPLHSKQKKFGQDKVTKRKLIEVLLDWQAGFTMTALRRLSHASCASGGPPKQRRFKKWQVSACNVLQHLQKTNSQITGPGPIKVGVPNY
ncbi:hypothetical protein L208DRAFT_1548059 [Tricholoma matsutake]|nr:hypothetical protein L208DRAFT_1548059 [Tricholoma matsutake 945]